MASAIRVYNETRKCYMKHPQALKGVENCALGWVEVGVTVRNLSYAEAVQARNAQAKDAYTHNPLPFAEWPGLIFRPADGALAAHRKEVRLMQEANRDYICECSDCALTREREAQRTAAEAIRFVRPPTLAFA